MNPAAATKPRIAPAPIQWIERRGAKVEKATLITRARAAAAMGARGRPRANRDREITSTTLQAIRIGKKPLRMEVTVEVEAALKRPRSNSRATTQGDSDVMTKTTTAAPRAVSTAARVMAPRALRRS